ncbi:hypothetical protein GQ457_12G013530 [Hibiscus cannabinus]
MLSILSIFITLLLTFFGRIFIFVSNSRRNSPICLWFYAAISVILVAESALTPLVVVFCAAMVNVGSVLLLLAVVCCAATEKEFSRDFSLALLNPGFGIFGRRSWTVQGSVSWLPGAIWLLLGVQPSILILQWCGIFHRLARGWFAGLFLLGEGRTSCVSTASGGELRRWPFGAARRLHGQLRQHYLIPGIVERSSVLYTTPEDRNSHGSGPRPGLLFGSGSYCQLGGSSPFRIPRASWIIVNLDLPDSILHIEADLDLPSRASLLLGLTPWSEWASTALILLLRIGLHVSLLVPIFGTPMVIYTPAALFIFHYCKAVLSTIIFLPCCYNAALSISFFREMDTELLSAMENLQFTAEEATAVISEIPVEEEDASLWLVGSVISRKSVTGDSVIRVFRSVWKTKNLLDILELRPNFFPIKPSTVEAKDMILKRRPWSIHNEFFSVKPYVSAWHVDDYDFQLMTIWIRVYRLPLRAMNRDMGLRLGGYVGKVLGVDHRVEGGNMGEFLRILVQFDIWKPLRRCVLLGDSTGKAATPRPLRYERLPEFYFFCGLVGHKLSDCLTKPAAHDDKKLAYGSWLKVQTQQPRTGPRKRSGIEYFADPDMGASDSSPAPQSATQDHQPAVSTPHAAGTCAASAGCDIYDQVLMTDGTTLHADPEGNVNSAVSCATPVCNAPVDLSMPEQVNTGDVSEASHAAEVLRPVLPAVDPDLSLNKQDELVPGQVLPKPTAKPTAVDTEPVPVLPNSTVVGTELLLPKGTVAALCDATQVHPLPAGSIQPVLAISTTPTPSKGDAAPALISAGPIRSSKRAIQGRYEFCHPIQAKRARLPPLSSGTSPIKLVSGKTGMSSIISPTEVAEHTPALVFLCETRLCHSSSSRIKASLGMEGCFTVDFGNGCNGLMLLWNNAINVTLLSYSATHIDATVDSPSGSFRFTGFHGYYIESMKHLNWSLFDTLRQASSLPWLIGGDFNELLCHSEKEGGRRKPRGLIENFRDCLHRNDLFDCKPSSGWFTFTYTNGCHGTIRERLDRFVASPDWLSLYPLFRATSSFTAMSDHCILLMDSDPIVDNGAPRRGGDYFRYDNCWATESACIDKVHTAWSFTAGSTIDKLSAVGGALREWQHDRRKSTTKRIGELQRCGRQANNGQEEGPLVCYSRTPFSDSRTLGAGGKHTIGGRKAHLGATLAHHVQTQCLSVR